MGEKYDGVRLCWNSLRRSAYQYSQLFYSFSSFFSFLFFSFLFFSLLFFSFLLQLNLLNEPRYTRTARLIELPPVVTNELPSIYVDGEFWYARGERRGARRVNKEIGMGEGVRLGKRWKEDIYIVMDEMNYL